MLRVLEWAYHVLAAASILVVAWGALIPQEERRKQYARVVLAGAVVLLLSYVVKSVVDADSARSLHSKLDAATRERTGLGEDLDAAQRQVATLDTRLKPFVEIAKRKHHGVGIDAALEKLAADMAPKLARDPKPLEELLPDTGLAATTYFFRSRYPVPLRAVTIRLKFDGAVLDCSATVTGVRGAAAGIVVQGASRLVKDHDGFGVAFSTPSLRPDNDIAIRVIGTRRLNVVEEELEAQ